MPRTCNREGCGTRLVTKTGNSDFRKHFCGRECKNLDHKEKMAARRNYARGRKCRLCGRAPNRDASVSRDTAPSSAAEVDAVEYLSDGFRLRSERPDQEASITEISSPYES